MGKYKKQRAPRKLKWTNIPNDDVASKPMESYWEKGRTGGKADREQERKRSQANWKNTGEVTRTVT